MKFIHCLKKQVWVVLLFTFALSFLSCQDLEENTYLEYGQVKWGMPPEEVLELLEVPKENVVTRDAVEGVEYYLLENVEFCGEKASQMALNFMNLGYQEEAGELGDLVEIYAYYPEDADMKKIEKEMKKIYGDSIAEIYEYGRSSISPNQIQEETWAQFKENARLVTGEWVNLPGEGGKTVHFDAYNLAVYKKKIPTFPKERIML